MASYVAAAPKFGNNILCGQPAASDCVEPCIAGFQKLNSSSVCVQECPVEAVGPSSPCNMSRTCVKLEAVCPMLTDVPYYCPLPDQFLGGYVGQSDSTLVNLLPRLSAEAACSGAGLLTDQCGVVIAITLVARGKFCTPMQCFPPNVMQETVQSSNTKLLSATTRLSSHAEASS